MSLEAKVQDQMKEAMRAKDKVKLEVLRAIKSAILLAKTEVGGAEGLSEEGEIALLQRLKKQRVEAASIFREQNRVDLAEPEEAQSAIIEAFLPAQMSEEELKLALREIIAKVGATGPQDMGKVMGTATKALAGKADGKAISACVRGLLTA